MSNASNWAVCACCGESCFAFSFLAAAFAAAICSRSAAELEAGLEETRFEGVDAGLAARPGPARGFGAAVPLMAGGLKTSPSAGRAFVGRAETVLLPAFTGLRMLAPETAGRFAGEGDLGTGGRSPKICCFVLNAVLTLLRFALAGVNPNPIAVPLAFGVGFALDGTLFAGEAGLAGLANKPSLVPGLLAPLLPFLLMAEAGRRGGPMGDSTGEKKLDLRRSFGVAGIFCRLSSVRSVREGRDFVRSLGRNSSSSGSAGSSYSIGEASSWKP